MLEQEATQAAFERQQKDLASQQAYIDRFRASATRSTQAKSREKLLNKIERIESPLAELTKPSFSFPDAPRSGKKVAKLKDVTHTYGDKIIFLGANLEELFLHQAHIYRLHLFLYFLLLYLFLQMNSIYLKTLNLINTFFYRRVKRIILLLLSNKLIFVVKIQTICKIQN